MRGALLADGAGEPAGVDAADANPALGAIGIVAPASRYAEARVSQGLAALGTLRRQAFAGNAAAPVEAP